MSRLSRQCGILNISQAYRSSRPVTEIALLLLENVALIPMECQSFKAGISSTLLTMLLINVSHCAPSFYNSKSVSNLSSKTSFPSFISGKYPDSALNVPKTSPFNNLPNSPIHYSLSITARVFIRDSPPTRSRRSTGSGGESFSMLTSVEGNAVQAFSMHL
jgi:hypothetical protein